MSSTALMLQEGFLCVPAQLSRLQAVQGQLGQGAQGQHHSYGLGTAYTACGAGVNVFSFQSSLQNLDQEKYKVLLH